jgi:transposase
MTLSSSRMSFMTVVWESSKATWSRLHEAAFAFFWRRTQAHSRHDQTACRRERKCTRVRERKRTHPSHADLAILAGVPAFVFCSRVL